MDALTMVDALAVLNTDRCIGCGLCVTTCPERAHLPARKPPECQPAIPKTRAKP
jgi:Fe-S-cluster-containing hydrogenase component 2